MPYGMRIRLFGNFCGLFWHAWYDAHPRQDNVARLLQKMNEDQEFPIITRELVEMVRERLQYIYLDMRRLVPNTREHDLMMECVREVLNGYLPFTVDKLEMVVDQSYALYLNFLAVENSK